MNENLHDIDDLFRSALEEKEETPSASVKESLFAHLDKKDAETYKKRFIVWKRAAVLLLLLLAGFVFYESAIWINGSGHSNTKNITKNPGTVVPAKDAINNRVEGHSIIDKSLNNNKEIVGKKEPAAKESRSNGINELKKQEKKQALSKKKNSSIAVFKNANPDANPVIQDETRNDYLITSGENLKEKRSPVPAEKIKLLKIDRLPLSNMQYPIATGFKIPAAIDSLLKSSAAKNNDLKKIQHFKPYWTLTGLVTYDRVNYKLDSDLPDNITSIRHREIHEPSYSVGILATRQLKERWGLQTGFTYSNTAIGISPQKIYALQDPGGNIAYKYITSSGFAYIKPGFGAPPVFGDSLTTTEAKHSLQSLSVPVFIKYTIGKNKFLFIPGAGLEANFITRAKLVTEIEDASNRETVFFDKLNGAKSFYWSFAADAELRYIVNKKIAFSIRPLFRYAISPITENNVVETFPYSFGAGLGITYKF